MLPDLPAYDAIATALADDLGTRKVFLQTASPLALERFASFAASNQLQLSFTNNTRSENDAWGGWKGGLEMEQAAVAAINSHVGAQSVASVSPELSLWTLLLGWVYGRDGHAMAYTSFCCPSESCKARSTRGGSNSLQVAAAPSVFRKLSATRAKCKERAAGPSKVAPGRGDEGGEATGTSVAR